MKISTILLVLIVSVPAMSQTADKWYILGGVGSYSTNAIDTFAVWHIGAGVQFNPRFGIELDFWPGRSGAEADVDDEDVVHTSVSTTIRVWRILQDPDVHFVFKGGLSQINFASDSESESSNDIKSPLVVAAGVVVHPQAKRSFEFSVSRVLDTFEASTTFKATVRFRF